MLLDHGGHKVNEVYGEINIREELPQILEILLLDRTKTTAKKTRNIIWATDNYFSKGREYAPLSEIKSKLVTGIMSGVIKPRALKSRDIQKARTKQRAEVFTPVWIVKKQVDEIINSESKNNGDSFIKQKWLEITCGEAPYITTRYDMETGIQIEVEKRVGFLDRKLKLINQKFNDFSEWQLSVEQAYKATYGFEWNGDSLLIARENLLYTYIENHVAKWKKYPKESLLEEIATIISYNLFQMDGLKYIIPLSETKEKVNDGQLSLFDDEPEEYWVIKPGIRVKIMNWETNQMEYFDEGMDK